MGIPADPEEAAPRRASAFTNGIWNAAATSIATLIGIAGSILIVRDLGPSEYGAFSYYVWLATILTLFCTLALPFSITKITSELRGGQQHEEADSLAHLVLLLVVGLNLLVSLAVVFVASQSPPPQRSYLAIIGAVLLPISFTVVLRSTLWGRERYRPVAVATIVASLSQIGLIILAYLMRWGGPGYVAAVLAGNFAQALVLGYVFWRVLAAGRLLPKLPDRSILRRYVGYAAPATLVLLYEAVVWQRFGIFFLERLRDLAEVGYYNLSFTVFGVPLALGWALIHGYYPAISRDYGAQDWATIRHKLREGLKVAAVFAVPLTFGGWVVIDRLILLLYGADMAPAIAPAQILLAGLLPGVVAAMVSLTLNAIGGIWLHVRLGFLVVVAAVGLNLVLIPAFGALGAALATTISQLAYSVVVVTALGRRYGVSSPLRDIGVIVAIGAATTYLAPLALLSWLPGVVGLLSAVATGACLYVLATWYLGYIPPRRAQLSTG